MGRGSSSRRWNYSSAAFRFGNLPAIVNPLAVVLAQNIVPRRGKFGIEFGRGRTLDPARMFKESLN